MGCDHENEDGRMRTIVRFATLGACLAVFCPAAEATESSRLALMPLPRAALGVDAAAFVLVKGSGVDSNAVAARHAGGGVTASDLARSGRITGYTLDYARAGLSLLRPARPLLEIQTIAELYRDDTTATSGLAFWRGVTQRLTRGSLNGVTIGAAPFEARLGDGAFAFELTYRRSGKPLLYVGDVVFRSGDLLGAVFVTVTDDAGLRARSRALARELAARIQGVAAGKIHGPTVPLHVRKAGFTS